MVDFVTNDALSFVTVIDTGNFTTAAKKLNLSPSILSKRIKRLETFLQVQLIQRSTRKIVLTDSGNLFYEQWKRIKEEINETNNNIKQYSQNMYGLLRINSPTSFGEMHMISAVTDFIKTYPEMEVELILGSRYAEFIYHGLDLAIFIKNLPNLNALTAHKVTTRSTGVYGAPEYFKNHDIPHTPAELINHNCLLFKQELSANTKEKKHTWTFVCGNEKSTTVAVKGNFTSNNNRALIQSAINGMGLIQVYSFMVSEAVCQGKLHEVLENYKEPQTYIHIAHPTQRYLPYKVKLFIDFIIKRFNNTGYWDKIRAHP